VLCIIVFTLRQISRRSFVNVSFREMKIKHSNLSKPAGYVIHQQFNIKKRYTLPLLCLCVLFLSQDQLRLVPLTPYTDRFL